MASGELSEKDQTRIILGKNVTAVDGRYGEQTHPALSEITSEYGLMKYRAHIEIEWFKTLLTGNASNGIAAVSEAALAKLNLIDAEFSDADYLKIKEFEDTTRHDVKAVEYWLRSKIAGIPELNARAELAHFGLTSEDINNLSYASMVRDLRGEVFIPKLTSIQQDIAGKAVAWSDIPLLGLTHGQPATPTTVGKTFAVPAYRLQKQIDDLAALPIEAKFNGATGNWNSLYVADPDTNWVNVSRDFVKKLGFEFNPMTTQIESLDWFADFAYKMAHIDGVLADFDRNTWLQIMERRLIQTPEEGATGSSTMPQKINPIMFENSEGNAKMAAKQWQDLAFELLSSRLERDLSGSTVIRGLGNVAGQQLVAFNSVLRGLTDPKTRKPKLSPNIAGIAQELDENYPVVSEAIQTTMRFHSQFEGAPDSYDELKKMTRGKEFTRTQAQEFIQGLDIPDNAKERLLALTAKDYTGLAAQIARGEVTKDGYNPTN